MTPPHIKVLGVLALLIILAWVTGSRVQRGDALNRLSVRALVALSLIALLTVVGGYFFPGPPDDEGAAAHIFQLAVVGVAVVGVLFLSSAKWKEGFRAVRPLAIPTVVLALAFGALYCLERYH